MIFLFSASVSLSLLWGKAWPIIMALIFFGFIIAIHELGHFVSAKLSGVKVYEFAIGMGPAIFKIHRGQTKYALRVLPIGGYVNMGEDEESDDEKAFVNAPTYKKIIILAAGAVMNLLLGYIIVCIMLANQSLIGTNKIVRFHESAVSNSYGLQVGDEIYKINETRVYSSYDVSFLMSRDDDGIINFVVKRDGEKVRLDNVQFKTEVRDGTTFITYDFTVLGIKNSFLNVVKNSFGTTFSYGRIIWLSLFDLVTGHYGFSELAGPVGTVTVIAQTAASRNYDSVYMLFAFITINVGIFNLLPLPALDGGRLFFLFIELIRRKKINPKYEGYVHAAGMAALLLLMVAVTFNDIVNLIRG